MSGLSLDMLKDRGAFVGPPVKKEIVWAVGDSECRADVWIRQMSYQSAISDIQTFRNQEDAAAGRISSSVLDEDGKPIFTIGDITGAADPERGPLCSSLVLALLSAISDVNNLGKPPATSQS